MSRSPLLVAVAACAACSFACNGPPAPDVALCRDVVHRLCLQPVCQVVGEAFAVGPDCETQLLANTGCQSDDFEFTVPSRDRFIYCRNILAPSDVDPEQAPFCEDVEDMLYECDDVVGFLGGGR